MTSYSECIRIISRCNLRQIRRKMLLNQGPSWHPSPNITPNITTFVPHLDLTCRIRGSDSSAPLLHEMAHASDRISLHLKRSPLLRHSRRPSLPPTLRPSVRPSVRSVRSALEPLQRRSTPNPAIICSGRYSGNAGFFSAAASFSAAPGI